MFASAGKAVVMLFDRDFAGMVLRSLLLTLFLFVVLFGAVEYGLAHIDLSPSPLSHPKHPRGTRLLGEGWPRDEAGVRAEIIPVSEPHPN